MMASSSTVITRRSRAATLVTSTRACRTSRGILTRCHSPSDCERREGEKERSSGCCPCSKFGQGRMRGFAECEHPDCIAREEKIKKLKELIEKENDGLERLESEIESLNARHARAVVEMETLDDRIDTSMAKRVEIDAQNEELQLILDEAEARKSHLQEQADVLKNEIADLTRKLETRDKELRDQERRQEMLDSVRMVFQRESPHEAASEEVRSVRALPDAPCEPS